MKTLIKTFLFTDVEESTKLSEQYGTRIDAARRQHIAIIRQAVETHGGHLYKTVGDGTQSAFDSTAQAIAAAIDAQVAHNNETDIIAGELSSRMAIHTCQAGYDELRDDYDGVDLNRAARLMSAGHGGQILLSRAASEQLRHHLPPNVSLRDMGEHRLKDLIEPEHIFQALRSDIRQDFPAVKTLNTRLNNLPLQSTPFIGREQELAAVCEKILRPQVRLLTLMGPGGIGKTRLALQAAAELLDNFQDGVFFVSLGSSNDPEQLAFAIAQTLGMQEEGGQPLLNSLKDYLRDKHLLLVLDNFEQVVGASSTVSEILGASPQLKILATSRIALHIYGEQEFQVPPLSLPNPEHLPDLEALAKYESIALFVHRAQAVEPDFAITNRNASAVAQICNRLDGLPLAIELAAATISVLTPQVMLPMLESSLTLLVEGARDLPARQQTLRATIQWSYDLLREAEQKLFRRLAIFTGGCTLEATEAVCKEENTHKGGVFVNLRALVDKSLLRREGLASGELRFRMLQTIKEYAAEQLDGNGEIELLSVQHANYFLAFAETAEPELSGPQQAQWMERVAADLDNLRSAINWFGQRGSLESVGRIGVALWRFMWSHGFLTEGRRWLDAVLKGESVSAQLRAKVLNAAGILAHEQGAHEQAEELFEESLALQRQSGDKLGIAAALNSLGMAAYHEDDYEKATLYYTESMELRREIGDKAGISVLLNNLGSLAFGKHEYGEAARLYSESLDLGRELGDTQGIASALNNLGEVAVEQGDYARAAALYAESLVYSQDSGDKQGIAVCLEGLAGLFANHGHPIHSARLFGASEALRENIDTLLQPSFLPLYEKMLSTARARLDEKSWEAAWTAGRQMTIEQAVDYAREAAADY